MRKALKHDRESGAKTGSEGMRSEHGFEGTRGNTRLCHDAQQESRCDMNHEIH